MDKTQAETTIDRILLFVRAELIEAVDMHKPFKNANEGWSVIMKELDKLWVEVCKKRADRSPARMTEECLQVAAMACRFILDVSKCPQECVNGA